jgi:hypothetical protein
MSGLAGSAVASSSISFAAALLEPFGRFVTLLQFLIEFVNGSCWGGMPAIKR